MPTIPTQSPFTYPNPNPSASPSFTQDDTSESFIPDPTQPMPTFTQTAFSQPATQPTQNPNNVQSQQFQQFQIATISANNAKFPYLEKEKYEIWAMMMELWIQNDVHNLWRLFSKENSQEALPEDHMPDFHHYDDARDIWMAVKARFGGNEESKKMRDLSSRAVYRFYVTEDEGLHRVMTEVALINELLMLFNNLSLAQSLLILISRVLFHQFIRTSVVWSHNGMCCAISFVAENEPDQDMIFEDFDQLMIRLGILPLVTELDRRTKKLWSQLIHGDIGGSCGQKNKTGTKEKKEGEVKFGATLARFEKWKEFFKNLKHAGEMHAVPPSLELICPSHTSLTWRKHSAHVFHESETMHPVILSSRPRPKVFPPAVDIKTLPEFDVEDPNSTAGSPNSVPCKSKAASVPVGSRNSSASVTVGGSAPAASRNRPAVNSAGRPNPTGRVGQAAHLAAAQSNPAGWSKRPAPVSAGRPVSAGMRGMLFKTSEVTLGGIKRPHFRGQEYWVDLINLHGFTLNDTRLAQGQNWLGVSQV
ncbi:hypothetical protein Tco_1456043 [Tanacetum coccineum]